MHEVSLVAELIEACERRAGDVPVSLVRLRHESSIPEAMIRQAFTMLSAGGCLEHARVEAEPFDIRLECPCGFSGVAGDDHRISSSLVVCPSCGALATHPATPELELLEVVLTRA